MNKTDLIELLFRSLKDEGITKTSIEKTIDKLIETITASMQQGKQIYMKRFGVFGAKVRKAGHLLNHKKGDIILIPYFHPHETLRKRIRGLHDT